MNIHKVLLFFVLFMFCGIPKTNAATTWTQVIDDSFARATSSLIGNEWLDPTGVGSISEGSLLITATSTGLNTGTVRMLRPSSESDFDQRIDVTFTVPAVGAGRGWGAIVRGKDIVLGGVNISPAITATVRDGGVVSWALAYANYSDYLNPTGTSSFSIIPGRSYTLSLRVENSFPAVATALVTDNASSTVVANTSVSISGKYGTFPSDLSNYFQTAGVPGLVFEAMPNQTLTVSNVKTYSGADTGAFTIPSGILSTDKLGTRYIATKRPNGGTAPYTVRWYRGSGGFTPPTSIDGSGAGTGTYIGTGQEITDSTAPTGVSNFSIQYRAVYFDSGSYATTGLVGNISNQNSISAKDWYGLLWVGDSITYGYNTSSNNPGKSVPAYSQTALSADVTISGSYVSKTASSLSSNVGVPGHTSTNFNDQGSLNALMSRVAHNQMDVISIMLGTNDAKDSVSTTKSAYKANIQNIISKLRAVNPSAKFVLNKPLWFKPDSGYSVDFSSTSLARLNQYRAALDELADGTSIVVGDLDASNEIEAYGWAGSAGVNNPSNATVAYPPAPTGGKSYLADGLHPYDGGAEMIAKIEWAPNIKDALLGNFTPAYVAPDITPPVISLVSSSTAQTAATISIITDELATSTIDFGITASYGTASSSAVLATSTSYVLTDLTPETVYHFKISAWDAAGNMSTSSDAVFVTAALPIIETSNVPAAPRTSSGRSGSSRRSLQAQASMGASLGATSVPKPTSAYSFTKNLIPGQVNTGVKDLQAFLNSKGFLVSKAGPGSAGKETDFFGPATKAALIRFQKENNIAPAIGFFGPITRAFVSGMR